MKTVVGIDTEALVLGDHRSLAALLLMYDSVSGEREGGTLKLLAASPMPGSRVLRLRMLIAMM